MKTESSTITETQKHLRPSLDGLLLLLSTFVKVVLIFL